MSYLKSMLSNWAFDIAPLQGLVTATTGSELRISHTSSIMRTMKEKSIITL